MIRRCDASRFFTGATALLAAACLFAPLANGAAAESSAPRTNVPETRDSPRVAEPHGQPAPQPPHASPHAPAMQMTDRGEVQQRLREFRDQIDESILGHIAVHRDGRVKSYGSFGRGMMQLVTGPRSVDGHPSWFMYMELMLRPRFYEDIPVIYIRNKPMRERIARAVEESTRVHAAPTLAGAGEDDAARLHAELKSRLDRFMRTGMISPLMLNDTFVDHVLMDMRQDLLRTARFVDEVDTALAVKDPSVLRRSFRVIAPPGGGFEDPWMTFEDLRDSLTVHRHRLAHVDEELKTQTLAQWDAFQRAWRDMDAAGVNAAAARLSELLPQMNPELYPGEGSRTGWPWSIEQREAGGRAGGLLGGLDGKWAASLGLAGLVGAIGLAGVIRRRPTMAALGLAGLAGAFIFHGATLGFGTLNPLPLESWYFSARNMTWVWLIYAASLVPLMLALVYRWEPARWIGMGLFLIAFGFHTFALLLRWYVSDRWPNSNMFEAVTTAAWFGGVVAIALELCVRRLPLRSLFALGSAAASMVALMVAYYMPVGLDPNIRNMMPVLHDMWLYIHTNVIILSYCLIFMAAVTAVLYLGYRGIGSFTGRFGSREDYARFGGAGSLVQRTADGEVYIARDRSNLGQVFDGTTMVLVELAFILLWAGTVMGAIWADHSWGRPWGWDPKEVFALNTFIVFLVLIHGRLRAADKGVWTAIVALIGAAVMLFNWIAINFVVTGLHSYA